MTGADRIPLGGSSWSIWPDLAVRGAGFPARLVSALCDPALAAAADRIPASGTDQQSHAEAPTAAYSEAYAEAYSAAYAAAVQRLSDAVRAVAADPRFREAIAWQNPPLVPTCLDKLVAGEPRNARGRNHEQAVVSYLQRYALKNETIGFFGPIGWARADRAEPALVVRPGAELLSRRTTYFESWGIDELAAAIADRPGVLGWLRPRRNPACQVEETAIRYPDGTSRALSPLQARLVALADGSRTVTDLLGPAADDPDALAQLAELDRLGLLTVAPAGPIEARPERTLADRLAGIADPRARAAAEGPLAELIAARDAVAAASGSAELVLAATAALAAVFVRHTGQAGTRRSGSSYAGRTLIYQDTVRDAEITVGRAVLDALGEPLALVLDSARWLLHRIAARYRQVFAQLFATDTARTGASELPLASLLALAGPQLFTAGRSLPEPIEAVLADFQQRWQRVLAVPPDGSRHQVSCAAVARTAAGAFATGDEWAWSTAIHASPDVMLAAPSAEAVAGGDFLLVLGELHMSVNTLEGRLFVEQHPDPGRLLAWAEADHAGTGRSYAIPPKNSAVVSSRGAPPTALLSPEWTYWSRSMGPDSIWPPAPVLAAADLVVLDEPGTGLVVRSRSTGAGYDLVEMLSDFLSGAVINAFRPLPSAAHQPRITLDRLVLSRESWQLPVSAAGWATVADESTRYLEARRWRTRHQLPERGFVSVPVEDKPTAVDFGSLALVNLLAKLIRRTAEADPAGTVRITELLPDLGQLWLPDADGERYSCEFRTVAVDGAARRP